MSVCLIEVDMKVITEEYLIDRLKESVELCRFGEANVIQSIIDDFEEIDTLTVSKLRPMCDAPKDGSDVQLANKSGRFIYGCNDGLGNSKWVIPGIGSYDDSDFLGWLPMPIYKPELTGEVEQCE